MSYTVLFAADECGAGDSAFRIIQDGFKQIGIDHHAEEAWTTTP